LILTLRSLVRRSGMPLYSKSLGVIWNLAWKSVKPPDALGSDPVPTGGNSGQKGVGLAFKTNCGYRTVTGNHLDVVSQGP
jgi:hypothetical protein